MAPFAHAVGLVDGQQVDGVGTERLGECLVHKALWRTQHQPHFAAPDAVDGVAGLRGRLRAGDHRHGQPGGLELGVLVVDERDERAHHHCEAPVAEGGCLEAQALARSGGHHHQAVGAGERGEDGAVLRRAKRGDPHLGEHLAKRTGFAAGAWGDGGIERIAPGAQRRGDAAERGACLALQIAPVVAQGLKQAVGGCGIVGGQGAAVLGPRQHVRQVGDGINGQVGHGTHGRPNVAPSPDP